MNWIGFAAGGSLVGAGLLLLAGERRAGMVTVSLSNLKTGPRIVWGMVRLRGQDRRRRPVDHEGIRRYGRARRASVATKKKAA